MSWELKDTINGTKIFQWSVNLATQNGYGSGPMSLDKNKGGIMHNPASGVSGNAAAKSYAESIINKLKNWEPVIMAQAAVGLDEVYIIQPLNYSCPACGDFDYNNTTWSAEVFGEGSKEDMKKGHKAFYDLSVYANKKYGTVVGSKKLHREISATACPEKSIQFYGSIQAVKDDINSNGKAKSSGDSTHYYLTIKENLEKYLLDYDFVSKNTNTWSNGELIFYNKFVNGELSGKVGSIKPNENMFSRAVGWTNYTISGTEKYRYYIHKVLWNGKEGYVAYKRVTTKI